MQQVLRHLPEVRGTVPILAAIRDVLLSKRFRLTLHHHLHRQVYLFRGEVIVVVRLVEHFWVLEVALDHIGHCLILLAAPPIHCLVLHSE